MKRLLILLFFGLCIHAVKAQVKIGDNPQNIDAASVLELESTDKVLVITRVTTAQMNAIIPLQGAMVYNTDVQSVHYYDGTQWTNIGGGGGGTGGSLTADPIVNDESTIVITPTANGDNLEVAPGSIGTLQIAMGGVNGTDDIQDNSIGIGKLQNQSVTQEKLSENSVGAFALDNDNIGLEAFSNATTQFISSADIVSGDAGNVLESRPDGAFYDDTMLMNDIQDNTDAIGNIGVPNLDAVLQEGNNALNKKIVGLAAPTNPNDAATKAYVDANTGGGSDNQNIGPVTLSATNILSIGIEDGMAGTVDLSSLAGGGGGSTALFDANTISGTGVTGDEYTVADDGISTTKIQNANVTPIKIEPSATVNQVLTTTAAGTEWANLPPSGGAALFDVNTISGTGVTGDEYTVADNAISTIKILDANVTPIKIAPSAAVNQVLTTTAAGTEWANLPPSGGAALFDINTISGTGVTGDEYTVADDGITSAKIENATILAEDLSAMGATENGEIIQWSTDLDGTGPGNDAGWEIAPSSSFTGRTNNLFFAGTDGKPIDTDATPSNEDNGGLFWDPTKRFDTGALYLGLKQNGNSLGPNSNIGNYSKLVVAEAINPVNPTNPISFPIQIINEFDPSGGGTGVGMLFTNSNTGTPGGAGLVYERTGAQGQGDFHFLSSAMGENNIPNYGDKVLTVENDGDLILTGNILPNNVAGTNGQVLTTNAAGETVWGATGSGATQLLALDTTNNEIDIQTPNGTDPPIVNSSIKLDGLTLEAANNGTDNVIRIKSGTIAPAPNSKEQVLSTNLSGNVVWQDVSGNLSTDNLTQEDEDRTYDMSTRNLFFSNGKVAIGPNTGTVDNDPDAALHVLGNGQVRAGSFKVANGSEGLPGYRFTNDNNSGMFLPTGGGQLGLSANGVEAIRIDASQNVGIGTAVPSRKLHVAGDLQVDTEIWYGSPAIQAHPDYVFQKYFLGHSVLKENYIFSSLEDIESFIKKNHHLPGIKSANQVKEEKAWNLGQSNLQNLEKIEELFLHTIDQEHKIKKLEFENQTLASELKSLQEDLKEIKALLQNK